MTVGRTYEHLLEGEMVLEAGSAMPPDNTKPPRYKFEPPPLGARVLMTGVEELARAHNVERPRVAYKKTEAGEHCVALIFPGWRRPEE